MSAATKVEVLTVKRSRNREEHWAWKDVTDGAAEMPNLLGFLESQMDSLARECVFNNVRVDGVECNARELVAEMKRQGYS